MEKRARLQCLAHSKPKAPTQRVFGLPAFIECLLKLSLHRLGSKGSSEIQRGAPSWWKCAWLLTLLSGEFRERLRMHRHETRTQEMVGPALDAAADPRPESAISCRTDGRVPIRRDASLPDFQRGSRRNDRQRTPTRVVSSAAPSAPAGPGIAAEDDSRMARRHTVADIHEKGSGAGEKMSEAIDDWWLRTLVWELPVYVPPVEVLVQETPHLFDPVRSEAPIPAGEDDSDWGDIVSRAPCGQCKEQRSPSGWGTPGCILCGGVEDLCLPMERHAFAQLCRTNQPLPAQPDSPKSVDQDSAYSDLDDY